MGNMVKILENFSQDEGFRKIRKQYFDKYVTSYHEIHLEIGKQEGLSEKEIGKYIEELREYEIGEKQ